MMANGNGTKKNLFQKILTLPAHSNAEEFSKYIESWKFEPVIFMTVWLFLLMWITAIVDPAAVSAVLAAVTLLSPIWLPIYLAVILWISWIHYIRYLFWFADNKVVLQIELPPEVEKSPLAMEIVMMGIYNAGGEATFISRVWKGSFRPVWSFEIACNEGRINFYIHCKAIWKDFITSRIYGQYPEARVTEVDDYASKVPFNLEEYDCWAGEYKKKLTDAMPIKMYSNYELDKNTDSPETKTDPLTNTLELMNNMGKDEYMWVQFIVKARKQDEWYGIYYNLKTHDQYKEGARKEIRAVIAEAAARSKKIAAEELGLKDEQLAQAAGRGMSSLTDEEKTKVAAIDRNMDKPIFEAGVRAIYIAKKDKFFGPTGAAMFGLFGAYRSDFNELWGTRGLVGFDYPWEDFHQIRKNMSKRKQFFFYKNRAFFYVPYDQQPVFLSSEELASLWHFPNSAVKTPGLDRVASRRADAPANLPIRIE